MIPREIQTLAFVIGFLVVVVVVRVKLNIDSDLATISTGLTSLALFLIYRMTRGGKKA